MPDTPREDDMLSPTASKPATDYRIKTCGIKGIKIVENPM
jgi:hypothetical protein